MHDTDVPDEIVGQLRRPFFVPPWFPNIVGTFLDDDVDWDDIRELLTERVERPAAPLS